MNFDATHDLNTVQNKISNNKPARSGLKSLFSPAFLVLIAAIELVFIKSSLSIVLGPVIALLFCYFYFIKKETVLVTAFIVVANDALGTILLGKISFVYMLLAFIVYELISIRSIRVRAFALFLCASVIVFQPVATQSFGFRIGLFTIIYTLSILVQYQKYSKEEFFEKFSTACSIIIALIALHAVLTGGVEFTSLEDDYNRKGILGLGIGDPNFSSLLLSAGLAFSLNNPNFPKLLKLAFLVIIFGATAVTISITGLIAFSMVCLLSLLLNSKISKGLFYLLLGILIAILLFNMYLSLPDTMKNATLDSYIARVEEKLGFLEMGDYGSVTTNRSNITQRFINHIKELPILNQMFGGNALVITRSASHNTYIDYTLQFGYVGLMIIVSYIAIRLVKCLFSPPGYVRKSIIILKLLYIVIISTLSVNNESTFAMMFTTLFLF